MSRLGDFVYGYVERYGYPAVGAVVRFVRTAVAAGVAAAVTFAVENWGSVDVPTPVSVAVAALLVAVDKYVRSRRQAVDE